MSSITEDEYGRISFAKIPEVMEIPNLLAVQLESYEQFLQRDLAIEKRKDQGWKTSSIRSFRSSPPRASTSSSTTATSSGIEVQ